MSEDIRTSPLSLNHGGNFWDRCISDKRCADRLSWRELHRGDRIELELSLLKNICDSRTQVRQLESGKGYIKVT